jgi:hypothetical protein
MNEEMILIKNKFNLSASGFDYWLEALKKAKGIVITDIGMEKLYKEIGDKYNKSPDAIERGMRYVAEPAREVFKEKYGITGVGIKNKIIMRLLKYELEQQDASSGLSFNITDEKLEKITKRIEGTIKYLEDNRSKFGKDVTDFCIKVLSDTLNVD